MKTVFSGIQPSGNLHIGNYIGSLSQWVKNQDNYNNIFCIVDLHAITVPTEPNNLKENTLSVTSWYIASGIDPKKSIVFVQSENQDHAQLTWILNCFIGIGRLERMNQFKEKKGKQGFCSAGLFNYPTLMASDILLYDTDLVPVGEDQKQHVELTRDIAQTINSKYGNIFKLPNYMPPPIGERIMSLQNPLSKMSKSDPDPMGAIYLTDKPDIVRKKIVSAVTDSGNEVIVSKDKSAIGNLIAIYRAFTNKDEKFLDEMYSGKGYKKFKEDLAETIVSTLLPLQNKYEEVRSSNSIRSVLEDGVERARKISSKKLLEVEQKIGLGRQKSQMLLYSNLWKY